MARGGLGMKMNFPVSLKKSQHGQPFIHATQISNHWMFVFFYAGFSILHHVKRWGNI